MLFSIMLGTLHWIDVLFVGALKSFTSIRKLSAGEDIQKSCFGEN